MNVTLIEHPTEQDWIGVRQRALVTIGKEAETAPTDEWKRRMLEARHSPIRYLRFSFRLEIPYWVSVHLVRHTHAQPYVRSQRNDRQTMYERNKAPQDAPVSMIWDMNAEELLVIANKRLCKQASAETQEVVKMMCDEVRKANPEFEGLLVPMCQYHGGKCHEMYPCKKEEV